MKQHKCIGTGCLTVVFSMAVGLAGSAPQDQRQTPSKAEADAYQAAHTELDAVVASSFLSSGLRAKSTQ